LMFHARIHIDYQSAAKLSTKYVEEEKRSRVKEIEQGERAALQLAMDERKRAVAEEKRIRDLESKDAEYAKYIEESDAKEHDEITELCKGDDELAKRIEAMLHDELLAEEIQRQEALADQKIRDQRVLLERQDAELAKKEDEIAQKKLQLERAQQLENDSMEAKLQQEIDDAKTILLRKKQEHKDAELSQRMQIQVSRQDHRQQRKAELLSKSESSRVKDFQSLVKQWEDCDADVEDVAGGICLTMYLPELRDIKVKVCQKNVVEVNCFRNLFGNEKIYSATTSYTAEFSIRGSNVYILDKDISFEYSSDTGLLFVYVEKVQINDEADSCSSIPHDRHVTASILNNGKTVVGAVREGFRGLSKMFRSGRSGKK
jgi:hypothetical protein